MRLSSALLVRLFNSSVTIVFSIRKARIVVHLSVVARRVEGRDLGRKSCSVL